jgi:hypothetical protein
VAGGGGGGGGANKLLTIPGPTNIKASSNALFIKFFMFRSFSVEIGQQMYKKNSEATRLKLI